MENKNIIELKDEQLEGVAGGNQSQNQWIASAMFQNKDLYNNLSADEQKAVDDFGSTTDQNAGWAVGNILKKTIGLTSWYFGFFEDNNTYGRKDGQYLNDYNIVQLIKNYKA